MKCWYELAIPVTNALRPDWVFPVNPKPGMIISPKAHEAFTPEWVELMRSHGLPINHVLMFYKQPWNRSPIAHVDMVSPTEPKAWAINWVVGGRKSVMRWYTGHEGRPSEHAVTMMDTDYRFWTRSTLTEVDSKEIQQTLTLVRTDVPHNIDVDAEPRWGISVRIPDRFVSSRWDEVVAKLQHLITG